MIKVILILSLVTNTVLGYFLITRVSEEKVIERLIIESHAEPKVSTTKVVKQKPLPAPEKVPSREEDLPDLTNAGPFELQDAGEKMENDRTDFMLNTLRMSEEEVAQHNKLRDEFYQETAQFWKKNPMRELTFAERRKMLKMEEALHANLEKLHGKKKWSDYQKYRENYNQQGFKRQTEDNVPFIFMGL